MSRRRPDRSIRIDDRARVPFAIVAIILLLSSVTIVYALEAREAPETSAAQSEEMDQTRAAAQAQLRDSVRSATQRAAAAPITKANSDSAIGAAIGTTESGDTLGERRLFENYVSVLVYREAQRTFAATGQRARGGTQTTVGLPEVDWSDESEVRDAIDRVEIAHHGSDGDVEPGLVEVTIDEVEVAVVEGDEVIDRRTEPMSVTVGTSVFELRNRVQRYDDELSSNFEPTDPSGFGASFAARLYPYSWGRAYFDRLDIANTGPGERAFPYVMDHNHTEVLANQALFATQEEVFGTRDPYHRRVMRGPQLCMASDLVDSTTEIYDVDRIVERANQSTPDSVVIEDQEDLCNNELLVGDVSGDMGELNFFDLVIAPLFDKANDQFQGQDIHLVPMAEMAYAETLPRFDYEDRSEEFREDLLESERFNESFVDTHFGEYEGAEGDVADQIEEASGDFSPVRPDDEARTFDDVVDDVYAVELDVDAATAGDSISIGGTSSPGENYTFQERERTVESASIGVERSEPIDDWSGRSGRLVTVDVTYTATVSATDHYENDTGHEETVEAGRDEVSLTRTYTIDGTIAPDVETWGTGASGVENVFTDRSDPIGNNWQGAPGEAYDAVFDTDDLESALSTDEEDLQSALDTGSSVNSWFDSHVEDSISVESTPDDLDMGPTGGDRTSMYSWLAIGTREEHVSLATEMEPINASMVEIVRGDPSPIREFREPVASNQTAAVREVTRRSDTYDSAAQLAEAEARHAYYQNLLNRIDRMGELNEEKSGDLTSGFDFDVMSHLEFITGFTAADVETSTGRVRGGPLLDDVDYQIDSSPTYLEMDTVNRSVDPAVRPAGNGPLEIEDTEHASMGSRYHNAFGFPGFPLLPFPPSMFYLQVDAWYVTLQGEYARFEVQATSGSGSSTGGTTLVRENRTVTIADQEVGQVEPVTLEQELPVIIVVPAPTLLAKGSPGVGDMWRQHGETEGYDCTDTWDNTGPGYDQSAVDEARGSSTNPHCEGVFEDIISDVLG